MSDVRTGALVAAYCDDVPQQLAAFEDLVTRASAVPTDYAELNRAIGEAHRLSGTALCLGFKTFGALFGRIQAALKSLRDGTAWEGESAALCVMGSLRAIQREGHHIRPERSALLAAAPEIPPEKRTLGAARHGRDVAMLRDQRILVVDDDAQVRALVRNALVLAGANDVSLAASGEEALQKLAAAKPTILISDWNMEPINGIELMTQIRNGKTPIARDAYVIFLTRERRSESLHEAITAGADYFIVKPFTQDSVLRALRALLVDREPKSTQSAQTSRLPADIPSSPESPRIV
jgi:CheY-like chemotaxis protein/HPt (histidine-containing phosphotransfer) domain-containing protein